jgi:hypothetical protein
MATTVAILGLVSINYLMNASVGLVESNKFYVCVDPFGNRCVSIFNITFLGWGVMLALRSYFFFECYFLPRKLAIYCYHDLSNIYILVFLETGACWKGKMYSILCFLKQNVLYFLLHGDYVLNYLVLAVILPGAVVILPGITWPLRSAIWILLVWPKEKRYLGCASDNITLYHIICGDITFVLTL